MAMRVEDLSGVDQLSEIVDLQIRSRIGEVGSGYTRTSRNLWGLLGLKEADLYYWAKMGQAESGHLVGTEFVTGDRRVIQPRVEAVIGEYVDLNRPILRSDITEQSGRYGRVRTILETFPSEPHLRFSRRRSLVGESLAYDARPNEVLWRVVRL